MPRRVWTPEQRQEASERAKARLAGGNAAVLEAPGSAEAPTKDEAADELKRLAAALFGAAESKSKRAQVLTDLEAFLAKLTPEDFPELASSDVVIGFVDQLAQRKVETNRDDPPGTIYNRGTLAAMKKPWTWRDLEGSPQVTFTLSSDETVLWNGLRRDYQADTEYTDYRCFFDLIGEARKNRRLAQEHVEYMMRKRNSLTDPSIATINTAGVRGRADVGTYLPGGGLFTPEFAQAAAGEEGGEEGGEE